MSKILDSVSRVAPDMTYEEFAVKFLVMLCLCIPVPMIGMATLGYFIAINNGYTSGFIPVIIIVASTLVGLVLGFFLTVLLIRFGHRG